MNTRIAKKIMSQPNDPRRKPSAVLPYTDQQIAEAGRVYHQALRRASKANTGTSPAALSYKWAIDPASVPKRRRHGERRMARHAKKAKALRYGWSSPAAFRAWTIHHRSIRYLHRSQVRVEQEVAGRNGTDRDSEAALGAVLVAHGHGEDCAFYRVRRPDPNEAIVIRAREVLREEFLVQNPAYLMPKALR